MNLNLISKRKNNSIYTDKKYCYKIFCPDYSKKDVFLEAFITTSLEAIGISVPSIKEIKKSNDCWMFQTSPVLGKTLFELINENPDKVEEYIDLFVKVQTDIHTYKCPGLPIQKQKLSDYINQSNLDRSLKIDLQDMLNSSPKHRKVCHGNLTPHNVVLDGDKIYITDWNHASQGNASADAARTYLWLKINMPDYANKYLECFCNKTNTSSRYVKNWIPIVAASRLVKSSPEEIEFLKNEISVIEY